MATVEATDSLFQQHYRTRTWTPLTTTNNDGAPLSYAWAKATVQVQGTFGAGGTLVLQGSNDGTNWYTVNDLGGTALSFTSAGLRSVRDCPLLLRPFVSAGDGTTALTVIMALEKADAKVG